MLIMSATFHNKCPGLHYLVTVQLTNMVKLITWLCLARYCSL